MKDESVNTDTRMACIFFAYANGQVIDVLKDRGKSLINGNLNGMYKSEEKLNKLIHNDEEAFKRPVKAFITFNSQEGYERCMEHATTSRNFLG